MPKGNFIKVDELIWCDDTIRELSDSAALRYIFFIAHSKVQAKDGFISKHALYDCRSKDSDIIELLGAGLLTEEGEGYRIQKYAKWQQTMDQIATKSVALHDAATIRQAPTDIRDGSVTLDPQQEEWLADAWAEWPAPGRGFSKENGAKVRSAFKGAVSGPEDWARFQRALRQTVGEYENSTDPDRRKYLGSFQQFCGKWKDVILAVNKPEEKRNFAHLHE